MTYNRDSETTQSIQAPNSSQFSTISRLPYRDSESINGLDSMGDVASISSSTVTSSALNEDETEERSWTADEAELQKAVDMLELKRLEVDYAVISHLYTVHKQRAKESKHESYKIAYKTNERKVSFLHILKQ